MGKDGGREIMPLPKECDRCRNKFLPRTSSHHICDKCLNIQRYENFKKMLEFRKLKYRRI